MVWQWALSVALHGVVLQRGLGRLQVLKHVRAFWMYPSRDPDHDMPSCPCIAPRHPKVPPIDAVQFDEPLPTAGTRSKLIMPLNKMFPKWRRKSFFPPPPYPLPTYARTYF